MDGSIHMRLGGEVDDGSGFVLREQTGNKICIPYIAPDESVAGMTLQGSKVLEIARVGELVEVDDAFRFPL